MSNSGLVITTDLAASAMRGLMSKGVEHAERTMLQHEQVSCPVTHYFGPGIYIRELRMSAGVLAIGHRQKCEHMNVLIKGRVLMLQNDGSTTEMSAPATFVGQPGRKMGWVLEDVVWQNVYATDVRDINTLESMFLDKSDAWGEVDVLKAQAAHAAHQATREDFQSMLAEYGISAETVWSQSLNESDQIDMPMGSWQFKTDASPIHGSGVFATTDAPAESVVGPARISGKRTPLGRYTNHSPTPNARMELLPNGDVQLVLTQPVRGCRGGENGDEVTIDYRQALSLSGVYPKGTKP
ncbi:MAG: SET domain-containing protein-lysine N-methyltransferase [Desulfurellales bacterium]|nr:MAG: SET domain-containing protein-lysine N-methyltransferase [Desulfurellales bacterium]